MTKLIFSALLVFLIVVPTAASDQEDAAADAVAAAFLQVRQAAHLSKLERMGRNTFREKVCKQDMRFPSGWINDVAYETSDPARLPESAQRLATWPDTGKTEPQGPSGHGRTKRLQSVICTGNSQLFHICLCPHR
jgi:hypothetical protein